ncbi:MAG: glycosyl transferase family 2, partial [Bdellovibrionia bacterium]
SSGTLFYFWLRFADDGPFLCRFNAILANLRSKYFDLPFGDQGFLIRRKDFSQVGCYPHDFASGEDHAFAQRLKKRNFRIQPIDAFITSSARKYQTMGWFNVTARHLFLTFKQFLAGSEV